MSSEIVWDMLVLVFVWTPKSEIRNNTEFNNNGFSVVFDNIFKNH